MDVSEVNKNVAVRSLFCYPPAMVKNDALGIRLEPEEREALDRAAAADDRTRSAMGRKIIVEWLRKNGWLKVAKPARGKRDHG